ncbi:TonB-dependent receptor [Parahaliea mediterranea]|uniref:TonB-dependent receptor n=1 Tax=Parahaliea mediterranea TaxID=651086 RepID=A0A939DEA0_9GAMM|nr:TonB-dependent receptor [Parahaliea mediterranea]MBN7796519.1 TonB-dependent receptor [Parahaliea mediterranea]
MNTPRKRPLARLAGAPMLSASVLAAPLLATAQPMLEEVVVTAQKREESLQDTPISLAALGSDELETRGIEDLTDLRSVVPNLQLTPHPNSAATARIYVRGIGNSDDQITQDPSVAVYMDGVYLARTQGLAMEAADIARIEVLRGPQGTLYGRNATGGAINYITEQPSIGEWGFKQQFTAGSRDLFRSKTTVNVPLGDTLAARVGYVTASQDGFIDNAGGGESRFGDRERDAWRADVLWRPADTFSLRYAYDRSDIGDSPVYAAAVPLYPRTAPIPDAGDPAVQNVEANDVTADGHSLVAAWDVSPLVTLKSITAYRSLDNYQNMDYHTGVYGPFPIFRTSSDIEQEQWSQELQLLGESRDGGLQYIAGLYYFDEDGSYFSDTLVPANSIHSLNLGDIANEAIAAFGQATWTPDILRQRLHLTLGLRWSEDRREASKAEAIQPVGTDIVIPRGAGAGDNTFTNTSPSLVVAYDLGDDINLYAKLVEGYKTGGFNTRASSIEAFERGFGEETLTSYEIGAKMELWDRRLRVNAAVFQADYEDIQINVQSDPGDISLTDVLNAGEATITGFELDATALLFEGFSANLRYGYLDAQYDEITDATGADLSDLFRFTQSPRNTVTADLDYTLPPLPFGELRANLNYSWQDDKFTSSTAESGEYIVGDYGLLNARLTLSRLPVPSGDLRVALWGKNLEDKTYYIAHFNAGVPTAMFGEPRTYGIDLIYEY